MRCSIAGCNNLITNHSLLLCESCDVERSNLDVSTPDLQQFTPEQIEDFCKEMEGLSMAEQVRPRIEQVEQGVQIIRQLQAELNKQVSIDLGADKYYD